MPFANTPDPEELGIAKSSLGFPVVGIGASAGGISALRHFFASVPPHSGMAYVVVMHLSPDHESALAPILSRVCSMPVVSVDEPTPIESDHVYVISPKMKLLMSDGHLRVAELKTVEGRRQSIDLFFRSLAQAHEERAVAVVLSGSGSDGVQGLKRMKEMGGVTLAQSLEDAEFDAMPRAAALAGMVDFVLPAREMPAKLVELWENARRIELPTPPPDLQTLKAVGQDELLAEEALLSIKALLRERTGHNFAHYKRGTVLRRLERRMQVNALPDLPSYRRLLDKEPRETAALLQDMLISVTNFFRDPRAFEALEEALKASLAGRPPGEPYRAWVAGCATGEEAYSVAILLREMLGPTAPLIQVFASDIDQRAIGLARAGVYPASIATDVSHERLSGFFMTDVSGFKVSKPLRDSVVFSAHNVLSDPPFTRMDLICCRNLMIYLSRTAQQQVLRSFHYALQPGGLLFLGSSEAADTTDGLFDSVDKLHRVYRASPVASQVRLLPRFRATVVTHAAEPPMPPAPTPVRSPLEVLHDRVLRQHAPPTVLVDADDSVLHVSERATHLLRLPGGAPTNKLMALVRPELRAELRAAMLRAADTGKIVEAPRVRLSLNGEPRVVTMTVRPAIKEAPAGLMLVIFDEVQESLYPEAAALPRDPLVETLERALLRTQEQLRNMVGESAASTEELRASNEELQTINEELRSTTEELETSREELQAVNEELITVNSELSARIQETDKANDDWHNLMASAEIGAAFVDRDMRLKRFTPQAATVFNLRSSDLGRPLLDITHRMDYPQLDDDLASALQDLKRTERQVRSEDGRWLLVRVAPYRTREDRIDGAAMAFLDITSRRSAEEQLLQSEQRMSLVAESMRDYAIITMDRRGTIESWSPGAERIFGHTAGEVVGQSFELLFTEQDRLAGKPQEELNRASEAGRADDDRWHVRADASKIYCSGVTMPLGETGAMGFAKITRDVTHQELKDESRNEALARERAASERLQETNAMKDQFLAVVSHELKNPLSVIKMNAQLISRLQEAGSDGRTTRSAKAILSAVTSQAQIIDDLLEFSRANVGKIALSPVLLDLAELVRNIAPALQPDVDAKQQTLSLQLHPATVFGDPVRLEQIIWNLVTNAVKFTPAGGAIRVHVEAAGDSAVVTVEDTGIGLDPRYVDDVFQMFKQVEQGASRTRTGLGIGLALVKQLAELHGGRVAAESEGAGRGSRFTVRLPLASGNSTALPASPKKEIDGLTALVVDDEPDQLAAFADLLEMQGCRVVRAGSAEDALRAASAGHFDVVISDVGMPEKDGHWLARRLRESLQTHDLALVAVSGMARGADRVRAVEAGFDALLGKPLDMDEVRSEIARVMAQRSATSTGP